MTRAQDSLTVRRLVLRAIVRIILGVVVATTFLFLAAGRLDWIMAWAYAGFSVMAGAGIIAYLAVHDPALLAERLKGFKGAKTWDKVLAPIVALVLPLALLIVAGLDKRFGWSPDLPLSLQIAAFAVMVVGYGILVWAMAVNTFFAAGLRIQKERGHTVIDAGPYAIVRHPGYTRASLANMALALVLGSLWAPAALAVVVAVVAFVLRTGLEDRTLKEELDGYRDYAQRVRFRLAPGLW